LKGDFNMVASDKIQGRVTLFLKNVSIKDALDIVLIANNLAYYIEKDIVYVMPALEYEAMFGKKFNNKQEVAIIHLNYAKPSYALAALDNIKSALGRIIIDEDTGSVVLIDTPQALNEMKKAIARIEEPAEVFTFSLQYARADVVAEKLKARIDANAVGTITADERSNKLVIRAQSGRRKEVEEIIKILDVPTKEVLVEARVLQVVLNPQFDFGIDWDLNFLDSPNRQLRKLSFKNVALNEGGLSTNDNVYAKYGKIAFGDISADAFEVAIRALKQVSDTKILSNPRILVTNNEEARIHVGDTVPYIISTTSGTGDNAVTSEDVRFVDVGLKLNVTPTINDDGFVTMRLKPEISTVVGLVDSQGGGIPQVNKTELETTVMIKDGMTIVMGGLKKENKVHIKKGIPFLMDIPYLGHIFSFTSDDVEATEIVIFITPHIITGDKDYQKYKGLIKPEKSYGETETLPSSPSLRIKE
ncbi:MAG: secretin N-terminal domain-containing protein, partial [Candidatus Omnitrophota bacterium]